MTESLPTLSIRESWTELLQPPARGALEQALPAYIQPRRWFGGKARGIAAAQVVESIPLEYAGQQAVIALVRVSYSAGPPDSYVLPLAVAAPDRAEPLLRDRPHSIIARLQAAGAEAGLLFDALVDRDFCAALLDLISEGAARPGQHGALRASRTSAFAQLRGDPATTLPPQIVAAEQSNSSIIFGERLIMKLFRRLESGLNPDLEIGRFLTEHSGFKHVPPAAGALEYHAANGEPSSLAILQGFAPNQGDAWSYSLRSLADSFARALQPPGQPVAPSATLLELAAQEPPPEARALIGGYLDSARLLGRRSAELHLALASVTSDPAFAPEPFAAADQQALYDTMRARAGQSFATLRRVLGERGVPEGLRVRTTRVLNMEQELLARFQALLDKPLTALRTRFHGDYHLGQVLYTGDDFMIIDFEGEPARPLAERRHKGSPLQDVAGMLRSFHYAPYAVLFGQAPGVSFSPAQVEALDASASLWHRWVSATFLASYLATAGAAPFLPSARAELALLLDAYLLDKAIYELNYELNNRPAWLGIPVEGILQLVGASE